MQFNLTLHFLQKADIGTIYVYENTGSSVGFKLVAVAEYSQVNEPGIHVLLRPFPVSSGARFGMSLLSLGRFDSDIYEDFAVGAPYENAGEGVVYIYRGSNDFWVKEDSKGKTKNTAMLPMIKCILKFIKKNTCIIHLINFRTSNCHHSKKL